MALKPANTLRLVLTDIQFLIPLAVLLAGLADDQVTVRECPDSYHVATLDNDAQAIFEGSLKFINDHASQAVEPAAKDIPGGGLP